MFFFVKRYKTYIEKIRKLKLHIFMIRQPNVVQLVNKSLF